MNVQVTIVGIWKVSLTQTGLHHVIDDRSDTLNDNQSNDVL